MNLAVKQVQQENSETKNVIQPRCQSIEYNSDATDFAMFDYFNETVVIFNSHLMIKRMNSKAFRQLGKCRNYRLQKDKTVISDFIETLRIMDKFKQSAEPYCEDQVTLFTTDNRSIHYIVRLFKDSGSRDSDIILCLEEMESLRD